MKKKRYSVEQIITAVKQHEAGATVADICRKLGIAEGTFYRWKKDYGGLEPDQLRELRQLREENGRLVSGNLKMPPGVKIGLPLISQTCCSGFISG